MSQHHLQSMESVLSINVATKNQQRQGRSQKWPKEGVSRPEIAKEGGFEGAEALQIRARTSFC